MEEASHLGPGLEVELEKMENRGLARHCRTSTHAPSFHNGINFSCVQELLAQAPSSEQRQQLYARMLERQSDATERGAGSTSPPRQELAELRAYLACRMQLLSCKKDAAKQLTKLAVLPEALVMGVMGAESQLSGLIAVPPVLPSPSPQPHLHLSLFCPPTSSSPPAILFSGHRYGSASECLPCHVSS